MKQFNLAEYLTNPSKKVVTRDGRNVTIHCTNYIGAPHIIAQVEGKDYSFSFYEDGRYTYGDESHLDLFFAPEKHEGWMNLYKRDFGLVIGDLVQNSEEAAKKIADGDEYYITTIKVEWEE